MEERLLQIPFLTVAHSAQASSLDHSPVSTDIQLFWGHKFRKCVCTRACTSFQSSVGSSTEGLCALCASQHHRGEARTLPARPPGAPHCILLSCPHPRSRLSSAFTALLASAQGHVLQAQLETN